jgi:hypothetical protein
MLSENEDLGDVKMLSELDSNDFLNIYCSFNYESKIHKTIETYN